MNVWPFAAALGAVFVVSLLWPKRRNRNSTAYAGKRIAITGASSGLGEEIAYKYAAMGAKLALGARREDKLNIVAQKCQALGAEDVIVIKTDFSVELECKKFIEIIIQKWKGIDILYLNAGKGAQFPIDQAKDGKNFREIFDTNVYGCVNTTIYALPHLLRDHSQIVVISSLLGKVWGPTRAAYSASKHALEGFFNSLRCEVNNKITITMIYPGFFLSEIHDNLLNAEGNIIQNVKRNTKQFMSTEEAARITIDAAEDKKRECLMSFNPLTKILIPMAPSIIDRIASNSVRSAVKHD